MTCNGLTRYTCMMVVQGVRSLLGSAQHNAEETVDDHVKENDDAKDIVVMDYAQPHRKPPIHNEKHQIHLSNIYFPHLLITLFKEKKKRKVFQNFVSNSTV